MTTVSPPQTQINSVIALYSNGQIQEALDSVETLTKDYPNEPLLFNIRGACHAGNRAIRCCCKELMRRQ